MPIKDTIGFEFIDEAEVLVVYTSAKAKFRDFGSPAKMLGGDERYRTYNELIFASDVSSLGDKQNVTRTAELLGELQGPDDHYKTAFVVKSELDFGLARQFNTRRNRSQGSMQVFFELEEALSFIEVSDVDQRQACKEALQNLAAAFEEKI